jgi:topoisomerase-4 subunit A
VITQSGIAKTIIPEITAHFEEDMIVLEKWVPNKPISAIYFDGAKEKYYVKRFMIENENREDVFISDHASSTLELVSTDWRPVVKLSFAKDRGKARREDQTIDIEQFISVKGVSALGNQLTKLKINQIDLMEPLPFEEPKETPADDIQVVDEEIITKTETNPSLETVEDSEHSNENLTSEDSPIKPDSTQSNQDRDNEGQITLF